MSEDVRIKIVRATKRVVLEDENGDEKPYVLKELMGKERDAYITFMSSKYAYHEGKPVALKNYDDVRTRLLKKSIHDEETGKLVSPNTIDNWPTTAVETLFDLAVELSGLKDLVAGKEGETESSEEDDSGND